ncbi:MAG: co-chaperone GroES [Chloroflexi bacterium]|nr:co-chaperone GroES [Chloroflexota bacterium]
MTTNLRPLGNHIVVEPMEQEEVTALGIVIPQTAKEKPMQGTVTAAGPGKVLENGQREEMSVKTGDKVLYAKYAGTTFKMDGKELLVLTEDDVLAIVL